MFYGRFILLSLFLLNRAFASSYYPYEIAFEATINQYRAALTRGDDATIKMLKPQIVAGQMRVVHGPTLREWQQMGFPLPLCAEQILSFLREPGYFTTLQRTYFKNASRGRGAFSGWFAEWLAGSPLTIEQWKANLREQHLLATGAAFQTPHFGPGGYVSTDVDEVHPGRFRNEVALGVQQGDTDPVVFGHVQAWLEVRGYPPLDIPGQVEVRGMNDLVRVKGRRLKMPTFSPTLVHGRINYPAAEDLDLFFDLAWLRLNELKEAVRLHTDTVELLADYYHTVLNAQFFCKVVNSVHFPEVNVVMELDRKRSLSHGVLDVVAKRMNYRPFRHYFKEYLAIYQIPSVGDR